MGRWRGGVLAGGVALIAAGLWFGFVAPGARGASAVVTIGPATQNIPLDAANFTVDVKVENVTNLGAYEFTIRFNKDTLEYLGVAKGNFLRSTGRTSETCISAGSPDYVNSNGALHFGCNTNGLIENGQGTPGPSGSGVLATLGFKPRAAGTSDLAFEGLVAGQGYHIHVADAAGGDEFGFTGLSSVEVCYGANPPQPAYCDPSGIDVTAQNGVVAVFDPNGPSPTAVPATPTPPPPAPTVDARATVDAALGTPGRTLPTRPPGAATATPPAGVIGGVRGSIKGPEVGSAGLADPRRAIERRSSVPPRLADADRPLVIALVLVAAAGTAAALRATAGR